MSIVWILVLSFSMVTLVGRAGCIMDIDEFTMGLVVVAIGTSIPVRLYLEIVEVVFSLYILPSFPTVSLLLTVLLNSTGITVG